MAGYFHGLGSLPSMLGDAWEGKGGGGGGGWHDGKRHCE